VDGKIAGAFVAALQHFLDCVRGGREPDTSPRRVLATALAQAAVIETLETKQPVRI
jgi:predicted dehydrogenase